MGSGASKNNRFGRAAVATTIVFAWVGGFGGCSSAPSNPIGPPSENGPPSEDANGALPIPKFAEVAQPQGTDISDVRLLFQQKSAPKPDSLKECDADFKKLQKLTIAKDEFNEGVRELVRKDPVTYHWCFYSKVLDLDQVLSGNNFIEDRQKSVLETYAFLVPVARGFLGEFRDSRYLRFASARYRQISERVFYRRLELTPKATSELVEAANPFAGWRDTSPDTGQKSPYQVLEKYNLMHPDNLKFTSPNEGVVVEKGPASVTPMNPVLPKDPLTTAPPAPFAGAAPPTSPVTATVPAVGTPPGVLPQAQAEPAVPLVSPTQERAPATAAAPATAPVPATVPAAAPTTPSFAAPPASALAPPVAAPIAVPAPVPAATSPGLTSPNAPALPDSP